MDRINGADFVDIGNGRRGFQGQNAAAGVAGTEVTDAFLNSIQEEILKVIEEAGLKADANDWTQLWQAIRLIAGKSVDNYTVPLAQLNRLPWLPVISMTLTTPPGNPAKGDIYYVPTGGSGAWSADSDKIAEWNGNKWLFTKAPDGHGIGLPDGRIFERINGKYIEKIALDVQSGKWLYAEAGGTANALTATLVPTPKALIAGMAIYLKIKTANTGGASLDVNWSGPRQIIYHETGDALVGGDFQQGDIITVVYDGASWRLDPTIAYLNTKYKQLSSPPQTTYFVVGPSGSDENSGFAPTPSEGFATIDGAIKSLIRRYLSFDGIKLVVSSGIFGGFSVPVSYIANWEIIGNGVTETKVDATNLQNGNGRGLVVAGSSVVVRDMTFASYYEGATVGAEGGMLTIISCNFELNSRVSTGIGVTSGQTSIYGNINFSGSGRTCISSGGLVRIGFQDETLIRTAKINYRAGMEVSDANIVATDSGVVYYFTSAVSQTGSPYGRKFIARLNGVINTQGAGENWIAGTEPGVIDYGGQYI